MIPHPKTIKVSIDTEKMFWIFDQKWHTFSAVSFKKPQLSLLCLQPMLSSRSSIGIVCTGRAELFATRVESSRTHIHSTLQCI